MIKVKALADLFGERVLENRSLRDYTTLKTGGVADFVVSVLTTEELIKAANFARSKALPYLVLGQGSKVLFSDFGFPGLVIINRTANLVVLKPESQIMADSGVSLRQIITTAASDDLGGLDFLYGLAGTLGGGIYANFSFRGKSLGDYVRSATLYFPDLKKTEAVGKDWFSFRPNFSKLREQSPQTIKFPPIILSAKLQLITQRKDQILANLKARQAEIEKIFSQPELMVKIFQEPESYNDGFREMLLAAGISRLAFRDARLTKNYPNFVYNRVRAKAVEIRQLIEQIRSQVNQKKGIVLKEALEYVGRW